MSGVAACNCVPARTSAARRVRCKNEFDMSWLLEIELWFWFSAGHHGGEHESRDQRHFFNEFIHFAESRRAVEFPERVRQDRDDQRENAERTRAEPRPAVDDHE